MTRSAASAAAPACTTTSFKCAPFSRNNVAICVHANTSQCKQIKMNTGTVQTAHNKTVPLDENWPWRLQAAWRPIDPMHWRRHRVSTATWQLCHIRHAHAQTNRWGMPFPVSVSMFHLHLLSMWPSSAAKCNAVRLSYTTTTTTNYLEKYHKINKNLLT